MQGSTEGLISLKGHPSGKDGQRSDMKCSSCIFEDPPLWQLLRLLFCLDFLNFSSHWGNFIGLQITNEDT